MHTASAVKEENMNKNGAAPLSSLPLKIRRSLKEASLLKLERESKRKRMEIMKITPVQDWDKCTSGGGGRVTREGAGPLQGEEK